MKEVSLAAVLTMGVRDTLVPRLTAAGERELVAVELLLVAVRLTGAADTRSLTRCCKPNGDLRVSDLYKLCSLGGVEAPFCSFIWGGFAPSRVKFFGWLLIQSRIQCRAALRKKKIILPEEDICPICSAPHEDATHVALRCPFASGFWNAIGGVFAATAHVRDLHALPGVTSGETASTFTLLCCWNLWKHRNCVVFRGERPCRRRLVAMCVADASLWRERVPAGLRAATDCWNACLRQAL
jgi:hypothetical protein